MLKLYSPRKAALGFLFPKFHILNLLQNNQVLWYNQIFLSLLPSFWTLGQRKIISKRLRNINYFQIIHVTKNWTSIGFLLRCLTEWFDYLLTVTLGQCRRDGLANSILISAFFIRLSTYQEPRKEVGYLYPAECPAKFEMTNFRFQCNALTH